MDWKSFLVKGTGIASIALGSQLASADIICNGCAYPTDLVVGQGAFLGAYDPATNDTGSYTHLDIQQDVGFDTPFDDLWVFDILADADGSTSANIAPTTLIKNFKVDLWSDNGTICAPGALPTKCALLPNQVIASAADDGTGNWVLGTGFIEQGRYILQVQGTTNDQNTSGYSGQLAVLPAAVAEPASLALLGLGLLGLGASSRRQRQQQPDAE